MDPLDGAQWTYFNYNGPSCFSLDHFMFVLGFYKSHRFENLFQYLSVTQVYDDVVQYNLSTPDFVYSGFLSNPAQNSGPNNFPVYLDVKNTSVIRIL